MRTCSLSAWGEYKRQVQFCIDAETAEEEEELEIPWGLNPLARSQPSSTAAAEWGSSYELRIPSGDTRRWLRAPLATSHLLSVSLVPGGMPKKNKWKNVPLIVKLVDLP